VNPWEASSRLSPHSPERYGWDLASITSYTGPEVHSKSSLGANGVLVDLDELAAPVVYAEALAATDARQGAAELRTHLTLRTAVTTGTTTPPGSALCVGVQLAEVRSGVDVSVRCPG
jgi:hypothetical protein